MFIESESRAFAGSKASFLVTIVKTPTATVPVKVNVTFVFDALTATVVNVNPVVRSKIPKSLVARSPSALNSVEVITMVAPMVPIISSSGAHVTIALVSALAILAPPTWTPNTAMDAMSS